MRGSLPAFVGREADIQELRQAWRRAFGGRRQVVLLAGEPGIGKTTLVERMAREVVADGGRVLWGTCAPDPSTPYAPVAEILARAATVAPADVVSKYGLLAHIEPMVRTRAGQVPPLPHDRRELFHAAAGLIAEVAVRTPVLLVVDDLHRAHRTTVRVLRYVLAATRQVPMMVIGTYCDTSVDRAHAVASLLTDLAGDRDASHYIMEGLSRDSVQGVLPNPAVLDAVWQRAGGNPLFLTELLRHVSTDLPSVDPRTLPESIDAGVARRLSRMDAGTRQLLAVATIIGPEFSLDTVARTGEVPPDRLLSAADEAVAEEIIEPTGEPNEYRFTHETVRSAVAHRVASNRGVHVHGLLATELERSPSGADDHLVRLAFHAAAASPVGGSVAAARHAGRAGDHAVAQLAYEEAAEWYGVALGLLRGHSRDSSALKCRLLVSLGDAHDRSGEKVRARHSFLEAVGIARTLQDPALMAMAESALGRSPWPVPLEKPLTSKIPAGVQNQHPFLMPEAPPAKLLPLGQMLAAIEPYEAAPAPRARPTRRSTPQVAAEREMADAARRASSAPAPAPAPEPKSTSKRATAKRVAAEKTASRPAPEIDISDLLAPFPSEPETNYPTPETLIPAPAPAAPAEPAAPTLPTPTPPMTSIAATKPKAPLGPTGARKPTVAFTNPPAPPKPAAAAKKPPARPKAAAPAVPALPPTPSRPRPARRPPVPDGAEMGTTPPKATGISDDLSDLWDEPDDE
ncbi:MAG: hypothetical protein QOE93_1315, partial [Actinomycetota bacterium]|nr:hypothetical protein [Actinomycetota bacterium]